MTKYIVSITHYATEYEVEADDRTSAMMKAEDLYLNDYNNLDMVCSIIAKKVI
jgi:hypothetical protein